MSSDIIKFLSLHHPVSLILGNIDSESLDDTLDKLSSVLCVEPVDLLVVADLDRESVGDLIEFCQTRPFGSMKLVVANLTGAAESIQRALLGILEATTYKVKFVLFSETEVLSSVASRCQTFTSYRDGKADEESRTKVLKALAAASLGEKRILTDTVKTWTTEDTKTLRSWACERLSGRYLNFSTDEVENIGLSEAFAEALLEALGVLRAADVKKVVLSVLMAQISSGNGG